MISRVISALARSRAVRGNDGCRPPPQPGLSSRRLAAERSGAVQVTLSDLYGYAPASRSWESAPTTSLIA